LSVAALVAAPARAPVNKWVVTLSVTFGTLMGAIDTSIVAVATPHLTGSLGATVEEMTWVTTGFVIATVVVMPLTAFLGRLFGQKRVYLASLALFVLGSALCGLARSLPMMVACRALQGLGAGALQPTEAPRSAATFSTTSRGPGFSTSTSPSVCSASSWSRASCTSRRTFGPPPAPAPPNSARTWIGWASCS
jgi:DHA2 family multidrug resistance protein